MAKAPWPASCLLVYSMRLFGMGTPLECLLPCLLVLLPCFALLQQVSYLSTSSQAITLGLSPPFPRRLPGDTQDSSSVLKPSLAFLCLSLGQALLSGIFGATMVIKRLFWAIFGATMVIKRLIWATTRSFYCKCNPQMGGALAKRLIWATTRSINCMRNPQPGGALAKFQTALYSPFRYLAMLLATVFRSSISRLLSIRLALGLSFPFLWLGLQRFLLGNHRFIPWRAHRIGYPASWMLLSSVMLSNHVVSTMIGTSFKAATFMPSLPPFPSRPNRYSTKSLRSKLRSHPGFFRQPCLQAAPISPISFATFQASIPDVTPFSVPSNHAELFGDIMAYQGAAEVLMGDLLHGSIAPSAHPAIAHPAERTVDAYPDVLIDTGASVHISSCIDDFIGGESGLIPVPSGEGIKGLTGNCHASGFGTISWDFPGTDGQTLNVQGPGYYLPGSSITLLSPQTLFRSHKSGHLTMDHQSL
jgi:hypothetical protein